MRFGVRFDGEVRSVEGDEEQLLPGQQLQLFLDDVLAELSGLEGVENATYTSSLAEGTVTFTIQVEADDALEAQAFGSSAIRSAIQGAEGYTPGWSIHWCSVYSAGSDPATDVKSAALA